MKSFKRLFTMILAIAMILTSVGIVASADSSFSDISDPKVASAVDKLVAYGIITGYDDDGDGVAESFKPENQITRAEFAAIVTRMKGVADNLPTDSVTGFWDLDGDDSRAWARPYVKAAVDLKIINGFPDGSFRAADPVTYEQAVKMLICAIGYDVIAQSEYNRIIATNPDATWSAGYISAAVKHGITKNAYTTQITEPANRGVVAVLTSNGVDAPALEQDNNGNLVKPDEGQTNTEGNMRTIEGYVTDTFYTGLDTDDTGLNEDEIIIDATRNEDDGKYTLSQSLSESIELDKYIGRRVTAYYDNLEGEITSIKLGNMSSTIIKEENVVSINDSQIKMRDDNDRTSSENISDATFIVNGKYVESYDFNNNFKNGTIEIFNATGKKIVLVNSYEVFVVNSFDRNNEKVFIKYATYDGNNFYQFPTRTSDKPKIYVKASGNSSYKLTSYDSLSLSQYDIINYLESPAGTAGDPLKKMYVTKGSKSGKVTAGLDEGRKVELNDTIMYLTQQYYNFEGTTNDKKAPFELSDSYTYYVDCNGQIAAINYSASASGGSWAYGYLVEVDTDTNQVGVFDTAGNYKIYTLKDTVRVDGEKMKASRAFDALQDAAEVVDANAIEDTTLTNTTNYAQPLKYSVSGGKIEGFDTVVSLSAEATTGDEFTYDGELGDNPASTSTSKVTVGGTAYSVNSTTFVLYVPKDRTDTDSYAKMTASSAFAVTKNRYAEVFGYDGNYAKMVLVYGANPTHNFIGSSPYMVITEVRDTNDNTILKGYVNGSASETSLTVSYDDFISEMDGNDNLVTANDVKKGDIIRYIKDNGGEIVAIEMVYDASEKAMLTLAGDKDYISESEGTGSDFVAMYGQVVKKDTTDNKIEILADKSRTHKISSNTDFFKVESNGDVVTTVLDEVSDGTSGADASTVILITSSTSNEATAAVIYIVE